MGVAVFTLSVPREVFLKRFAQAVAEEKGLTEEFKLYDRVEGIAGKLIMEHRKLFKNVCANVDFYSGFVYSMLGIPEELFTPIFAIARMPGWSAHRLEELINANKIIRPAYKYVGHHTDFVAFDERKTDETYYWLRFIPQPFYYVTKVSFPQKENPALLSTGNILSRKNKICICCMRSV